MLSFAPTSGSFQPAVGNSRAYGEKIRTSDLSTFPEATHMISFVLMARVLFTWFFCVRRGSLSHGLDSCRGYTCCSCLQEPWSWSRVKYSTGCSEFVDSLAVRCCLFLLRSNLGGYHVMCPKNVEVQTQTGPVLPFLPFRKYVKWPEVNEDLMPKEKLTSWSSGPFDCFQDLDTCCWTCPRAANMDMDWMLRFDRCQGRGKT